MNIDYEVKSKHLLTVSEEEQLHWLCLKGGHMIPELLNKFKLGMVVLAKKSNKIIGWSIFFERDLEQTLFLYISNKFRRCGIGREIININRYHFGNNFYTSPHDKRAAAFFKAMGK